ncbi:SDR family NAD(P)-dependent oxidoreductase [Altererythrobacter sp. ZODW24]|uniref:SDR family NAD(P)-dependent oxidoreductase n=1 Tax=Altererythrobacter sp. ZODW24 TaxID=2185142 RepID=UPI000DF82C9C|nr:SDR family NAD(P)-dependent oxidoreductase [Altererythrobacter sp. ZODW24]
MNETESGNRVACIFGATGGIGAAMTQRLANDPEFSIVHAGSRSGNAPSHPNVRSFQFELTSEQSIRSTAESFKDSPPDLVVVATGVLTLEDGTGPEKSYRSLDAEAMAEVLTYNTIGPAMVAKHFLPLLPRDRRAVFAALSARVGSISDNKLGGWHSYRASKAALNMLIRNFAIEMGRSHKQAIIAGLHPGTVDTSLSEPFQGNVAEGKLFTPDYSAERLLNVLEGLTPSDSGGSFAWDGERVLD